MVSERSLVSALNATATMKALLLRLATCAILCLFAFSSVQITVGFVSQAEAQSKKSKSRAKQDKAAWQRARRQNSCSSYNRYLQQNPRGRYMRSARSMMAKCKRRKKTNVRRSRRARSGYYPRYRYPMWPRHRYRPWPRPPIVVVPPSPRPPIVDPDWGTPDWGVSPPSVDPDWGVGGGGDFGGAEAMPLPSLDF